MSRRQIAVPERTAHPSVAQLFQAMKTKDITYRTMEKRSGVSRYLLSQWHLGATPKVADLEAALNVVGLYLVTRTKRDD